MDHAASTPNPLGKEKISKLIARFSVPAILSMLVGALYNIVDQIFIGNWIGVLGNAATNVAFPLTTICIALSLLVGIGSASNFSLRLGEGKKDEAAYFAGNCVSLTWIIGIALGIVTFLFLEPVLLAFGATPTVLPYAEAYTGIITLGMPFLVFSTAASHMIRADGSPKYSMACMMAGAVFNIIFDPIFMITLDMGIEGIAWATTISQMLSSALAGIYLLRKFRSVKLERKHLRVRRGLMKQTFSLGSAACINQFAMTIVQITMNNVMTYYGALSIYGSDIPLAVVGVVSKINVLFLSVVIGIAQGCQPIYGFNYGARQYGRVKETYRRAVTAATIVAVGAFLCFQLFPRQITAIFGQGTEEYFRFAEQYFRIFMFATFINGIHPVTSNFFTSIGKAKRGIFISLTRQIIFLLPLVLLLPVYFGIEGVMYAGPVADGVSAALAILFAVREVKELTRLQRLEAGDMECAKM